MTWQTLQASAAALRGERCSGPTQRASWNPKRPAKCTQETGRTTKNLAFNRGSIRRPSSPHSAHLPQFSSPISRRPSRGSPPSLSRPNCQPHMPTTRRRGQPASSTYTKRRGQSGGAIWARAVERKAGEPAAAAATGKKKKKISWDGCEWGGGGASRTLAPGLPERSPPRHRTRQHTIPGGRNGGSASRTVWKLPPPHPNPPDPTGIYIGRGGGADAGPGFDELHHPSTKGIKGLITPPSWREKKSQLYLLVFFPLPFLLRHHFLCTLGCTSSFCIFGSFCSDLSSFFCERARSLANEHSCCSCSWR